MSNVNDRPGIKDKMLNLYQSHRPVSTTLLSSTSISDSRRCAFAFKRVAFKSEHKKHTVVSFNGFSEMSHS